MPVKYTKTGFFKSFGAFFSSVAKRFPENRVVANFYNRVEDCRKRPNKKINEHWNETDFTFNFGGRRDDVFGELFVAARARRGA